VFQRSYGTKNTDMGSSAYILQATTGPIAVSTGDYFVLSTQTESDVSVTIGGTGTPNTTFMSLHVIGTS
jgi:hypothetical protein